MWGECYGLVECVVVGGLWVECVVVDWMYEKVVVCGEWCGIGDGLCVVVECGEGVCVGWYVELDVVDGVVVCEIVVGDELDLVVWILVDDVWDWVCVVCVGEIVLFGCDCYYVVGCCGCVCCVVDWDVECVVWVCDCVDLCVYVLVVVYVVVYLYDGWVGVWWYECGWVVGGDGCVIVCDWIGGVDVLCFVVECD